MMRDVSRGERQALLGGPRETTHEIPTRPGSPRWRLVFFPLIIITYFLGYIVTMVAVKPYLYDKVAEEFDYQLNSSAQQPCVPDMTNLTHNTTAKKIQEEIERRVSNLELYLHLSSFGLAFFPVIILGPLTDRYGRRIGLLFPVTGTLCKQFVYLAVMSLNLRYEFLFIGHICDAIGGSFGAMLSAIFSVVSDTSEPGRERSFRIAAMEALQTLAASCGQVIVSEWMSGSNYPDLTIYSTSMCTLAWLLTMLLMPETHRPTDRTGIERREALFSSNSSTLNRGGARCPFGCLCLTCRGLWVMLKHSMYIYYIDETGRKRLAKRRITFAIFVLTVAVNFSASGIVPLFEMKYPICWSATKTFTLNGVKMLLEWVAILVILALLQRLFKMADRHVAVIGVISNLSSCALLSLAVNSVMVYESMVAGLMVRSIIPMLRSILSSLVDARDQGAVFAGMGCLETIGASVFWMIANRIYNATLATWAGATFFIFAVIMFLALVLLVILNIIYHRESRQRQPQRVINENEEGNSHVRPVLAESEPRYDIF